MSIKEKISYTMAAVSLVCGYVLLFLGYFAPPRGVIEPSVLYAFGEISVFVGSVMGIGLVARNNRL